MKQILKLSLGLLILGSMFIVGISINLNSPVSVQMSSQSVGSSGTEKILNEISNAKLILADRSLLPSDKCAGRLNEMYNEMYKLRLDQFSLSDLKSNAPRLIQALFDFRLFVRNNLQNTYFEPGVKISEDCAFAHRRLFRAIRVFEDYIGMLHENVLQAPGLKVKADDTINRVFEGSEVNFQWNEKYKPETGFNYIPQSGDVLLSRGSASVSAAIARITDEDSHFSHAGIVYVDPDNGKIETIEAHIEFGTLVADIKEYRDMKVRALVFRYRNPDPSFTKKQNADIAHQASKKVRDLVLNYKKKATSNYPNPCYDFSMKIDNPEVLEPSENAATRKCLFCSEVVSLAYSLVEFENYGIAKGQIKIPTFMSKMNPKNRKFLNDIGVTETKTFAPADMEIEPYFDLVLEWRDFVRMHKTHVMDALLTSLYSWMDDFKYQFYVPKGAKIKTNLAYGIRRIPILDHVTGIDQKFPLNMGQSAINTMVMLDESANQLANVIYDREKKLGVTLSPAEMIATLNDWRVKDLADFKLLKEYGSKKDPLKDFRVHHFLRAREN